MAEREIYEELSEEESEIITLIDENGNDVEFEFLDIIEYQGEEYILLIPTEESDDMEGVVIFRIEPSEDGEDSFVGIDNDDVLIAVFNIFKEKYKDEFDFEE